jgi:hypothetical protein
MGKFQGCKPNLVDAARGKSAAEKLGEKWKARIKLMFARIEMK